MDEGSDKGYFEKTKSANSKTVQETDHYNPGKKLLYFYISLVVLHIGLLYAISSIITH